VPPMKTTDRTVLFQKIISPVLELMDEPEIAEMPDSARKLTFPRLVGLMLYLCIKGLDSLRSLHSEMKKNPQNFKVAKLTVCGVSTISDAFHRYPLAIVQRLYQMVLAKVPLPEIDEFRTLGRLVICDGSLFPISIRAFWAVFKKHANSLKMHLCFSLNKMLPVCFLTTNGKGDERKAMHEFIEKGITYIADRGYIAFDFFCDIAELMAFFIIRSRKNLHYQVQKTLTVDIPKSVSYIFLNITDELMIFDSDRHCGLYRRISFRTRQTLFILVTNRFDLTTFEIIKLYCFRWQIELFFRYFKHTLQAKHLLNLSEVGVPIHFYVVLIAHLLLVLFKYQQQQIFLFKQKELNKTREEQLNLQRKAFHSPEEFVFSMGNNIPVYCKIKKHELLAIRDALLRRATNHNLFFT
jgi:hypothetical protein